LSRHRKIQCSRSKAVALIAAGAFTAATAAAATWPAAPSESSGSSGPAVGRVHEAGAGSLLTVTGQTVQMQAFEQSTASQALQAYQLRDQAAELSAAHWQAASAQAARKLAAAKAAAAAHATQNSATQNSATQNTGTAQPTASASASAQPVPSATASAAPVAAGSPQQIAQAMLASFGWSSGQFSCLDPLWAHESGWSVTAYNAGSGAYGIPQALPGSRMASAGPDWQTNAATQIRWGLEYIKGTYGSPCAAWDHEQATGWY
jgi:hypothetical protein